MVCGAFLEVLLIAPRAHEVEGTGLEVLWSYHERGSV